MTRRIELVSVLLLITLLAGCTASSVEAAAMKGGLIGVAAYELTKPKGGGPDEGTTP